MRLSDFACSLGAHPDLAGWPKPNHHPALGLRGIMLDEAKKGTPFAQRATCDWLWISPDGQRLLLVEFKNLNQMTPTCFCDEIDRWYERHACTLKLKFPESLLFVCCSTSYGCCFFLRPDAKLYFVVVYLPPTVSGQGKLKNHFHARLKPVAQRQRDLAEVLVLQWPDFLDYLKRFV